MNSSTWLKTGCTFLLVIGLPAPGARAGVVRDLALGLGYAGFDIEGSTNPLSGGINFNVSRNMVGNPLDFGAWSLTLRGPVSFDLSTGGRLLPRLDAALTIDLTGIPAIGRPGYELNYDIGAQSVEIDGSLAVDAGLSLNALGFYDLGFTYSSSQDVVRSGLFANDEWTDDFDLGPVNVSGNIYADVLAVLTQPFYDRAGQPNPFTGFSGPGSLAALLTAPPSQSDGTLKRLAAGIDLVEEARSNYSPVAMPFTLLLDGLNSRIVPLRWQPRHVLRSGGAAVPEPAVLLLMLLGLPAVAYRRLARRNTRR